MTYIVGTLGKVDMAQIMNITALGMGDFTDSCLRTEMQSSHLEPVVATIFKHHAMPPVPLGRVDDAPAVGQRVRNRHLTGHVLAVLHGINGNVGMQPDTGADID